MSDLSGQTLGPYTLVRPIGEGGMATVYLAHPQTNGPDVAIKVLSTELAGDPDFTARFRRESQTVALLQHPHILPVINSGEQGEYVYLVMRLMTGGTLADELDKGPASLNRARWLLGQIASALTYAHNRGVIHRDLKPENILLDEKGDAYLTDFGIAKMLGGAEHLTRTGLLLGTPSYMAPEQWRSMPVDARTDVYALGIILYEMLVGLQPFEANTPYELMYEHLDKLPPSPIRYHPGLPTAVEGIVYKAIAKDPKDRYASAQDMSEAFILAVARATNTDYRPARPNKRFPTLVQGMQPTFEDSTHELPRAQPEDLPDWANRLMGAPQSSGSQVAPPPVSDRTPSRAPAAPPAVITPPRAPVPAKARTGPHPMVAVSGGGGRRGRILLLAALGLIVIGGVILVVVLLASHKSKNTTPPTGTAISASNLTGTAVTAVSTTPPTAVLPTATHAAIIVILSSETPGAAPAVPTTAAPATDLPATPVAATTVPATATSAPTLTPAAAASPTRAVIVILSSVSPSPQPASNTPEISTPTPIPATATAQPTSTHEPTVTHGAIMILPSDTPTASVTPTIPTATGTPTPDLSATAHRIASDRITQTAAAWTATPSPTRTPSATRTPIPSDTPMPSPTVTPSLTETPLPTATPSPTATETQVPTPTLTATQPPTLTPTPTPQGTCYASATNTAVNIRSGPGIDFAIVDHLNPGDERAVRLYTATGFVYLDTGWADDTLLTFSPADVCAAFPRITAQTASAQAVCTIDTGLQFGELRAAPNPTAERAYLLERGVKLSVFRVVTGADGQKWYYAATQDSAWHFGWIPAAQLRELTPCPAPEAVNLITNGNFSNGETGWLFYGGLAHSVTSGKLHAYRSGGSSASFYQDLSDQSHNGDQFTVSFRVANPSSANKTISVSIRNADNYTGQMFQNYTIDAGATETEKTFTGTVTADWATTRLEITVITDDNTPDLTFDDISVTHPAPVCGTGDQPPCPTPEPVQAAPVEPTATATAIATAAPTALECEVTPGGDTAVNIRSGPGAGFRVVSQLQPGTTARAQMQTEDTGFVYVLTGWLDNTIVRFTPENACAALPSISAQDSSAAAVCTITATQSPGDLRTDPDPGADRAYLVQKGSTLSVFRVVTGADGQKWYYAATNDPGWHFGWVPATQANESTACPAPESGG